MVSGGTEVDPHANKRRKTVEPLLTSSSSDAGKGKSKVENLDSVDDESEVCCGICLLEAGQSRTLIQGCIDCCDHFFCFLCIMEWSKVESRCPMCKRRFSTIFRPPNPPAFPSERVVPVPLRDQVYHHFGNVTAGPSDPYSEFQCTVCSSSANECFLLLCDLCDAASHTYCIGLGATVPDGDWFCSDCSLLRTEHAKTDTRDECDTQLKFDTCHQISETGESTSIFDIVRETDSTYVEGLSSVDSDPSSTSPQVVTSEREPLSNDVNGSASSRTKLSAKTLWRCCNVHDRIRTLRENWAGLQGGSMRFPSTKNHGKNHGCGSDEPCSDEIDKAWKMRDIAKSMMHNRDGPGTLPQASKLASKKMNTCREAGVQHSISLSSHRKQLGFNQNCHMNRFWRSGQQETKESATLNRSLNAGECFSKRLNTCIRPGSPPRYHPLYKNNHKNTSQVSRQQQTLGALTLKGSPNSKLTSKEGRALFQHVACDKSAHVEKKNIFSISSSLHSSVRSAQTVSSISHSSSRNNAKPLKGKVDEAKAEIQSVVKLNLTLLSRDKRLEAEKYKEIARLATHSILEACGLEPGRHGIPSFPCIHVDEVGETRRSTLMPDSCRECFYLFVKDVVSTILLERKGST